MHIIVRSVTSASTFSVDGKVDIEQGILEREGGVWDLSGVIFGYVSMVYDEI